jgi:hypothetical protein
MIKECHEKKSVPTQTDILKGQTPAQRLRTARQLLDLARALKRAALRQQHSEWTVAELDRAVARIFLHART